MSSKQFTAALVSSASDDWLDENEISADVVPTFDSTVDDFLAADAKAAALTADGISAINATGITAADIREGKLDALFEDTEALLEAAPVLIGAPPEVQAALQARAQSVLAETKGLDPRLKLSLSNLMRLILRKSPPPHRLKPIASSPKVSMLLTART